MSHNDITGDRIATKPATDKFREGWDGVFGKPLAQPAGCIKCPRDPAKVCGYCGIDFAKKGGSDDGCI